MAKVSSRCLLYFLAAILVEQKAPPIWRLLHTGHCMICAKHFDEYLKFDLGKLRKVLSLLMSYSITIQFCKIPLLNKVLPFNHSLCRKQFLVSLATS